MTEVKTQLNTEIAKSTVSKQQPFCFLSLKLLELDSFTESFRSSLS